MVGMLFGGLLTVVAVVGGVVLCVALGGWGLSLSARIVFGMKLFL